MLLGMLWALSKRPFLVLPGPCSKCNAHTVALVALSPGSGHTEAGPEILAPHDKGGSLGCPEGGDEPRPL